MKKLPTNTEQQSRGFTLIELLVSLGVFTVIVTLAASAYVIAFDIARRAQAIAAVTDSLAFALEDMARSIRTGSDFRCRPGQGGPKDCPLGSQGGSTLFSFTNAAGVLVEYKLAGTGTKYIEVTLDSTVSFPLTPATPEIDIQELKFFVEDSESTTGSPINYGQPYARIVIVGNADAGKGNIIPFHIQTSAVMRGTDI